MIIRTAEIKPLEEEYQANGNRLVIYYGDENCQKEQLLKYFMQDKKAFYYRACPASEQQQRKMMVMKIKAWARRSRRSISEKIIWHWR